MSDNTLCWKCQNACGKCSWSARFEPVKGWKAKETIINNYYRSIKSYEVINCPDFEKMQKSERYLDNEREM